MKYLKIIFLCCVIFLFCRVVDAKIIGVDEVANEFSTSYTIKTLNAIGSSLSASVDKTNNKINFFSEDGLFCSFVYTSEYIEYDIRDIVITDENYWNYFTTAFAIEGVMESLLNLSGHQDISIMGKIEEESINYEEHGVQLNYDTYLFSDNSGSGGYVNYFKITLNSDIISNLARQYGEKLTEEEESNFKDAIPTVRIGDEITSNSVYLYANIEGYEAEKEIDTPMCNFYRSTSLDGEFELVTDWQTACLGGTGVKDENLKSGTTYYYKAKVVGGNNYSDVVSVTTLKENISKEEPKDNNVNDENTSKEDSKDNNVNDENTSKEEIEEDSKKDEIVEINDNNKLEENHSNSEVNIWLILLVVSSLSVSVFSFIMMYKNLKFI